MKNFLSNSSALAIVACLLWASAFAAVKIGLEFVPPFRFAGIRFFLAGLILLPFVAGKSSFFTSLRSNFRSVLLVAVLQTLLHYALFYKGMNLVPGALGAIVVGAGPLFVSVTAHFMLPDDKLSWKKLAIIFLGICGIVFVSLGRSQISSAGSGLLIGVLLLMITNLNSGFVNILVAKRAKTISPIALSSVSMIIGGAMLIFLSLMVEKRTVSDLPPQYYIALAWLSTLSAVAYSIWYSLLRRPGIKVSSLNFWKFLIPVFGALLSWIMLPDESPDVFSLTGMAVTGTALILMNRADRKERMAAPD